MKQSLLLAGAVALCTGFGPAPLRAEMSDAEKALAALAVLGIAAMAHNKHHYPRGYAPANGTQTAEFERGYRDALHGYTYDQRNGTRDYATGYQSGLAERENAVAHRQIAATGQKAPQMALSGCARIVAQNFAVGTGSVHFVKSRSLRKHEWDIEATVGREHMVCKMRDSGEVLEVRGGKL